MARSTFASEKAKNTSRSDRFWRLRCRKSARRCGAKHISKSKCTKHQGFGPFLDVQMSFRVAGARDCARAKREGFEAWDICRGSAKMPFPWQAQYKRHVHQIFRFAEMILRDRCSTSYDLASLFRGRRSSLDRWTGKIAKRIGTRPSALHSTFHFGRTSRRIASFFMLPTSKNEEVSQNCFVFDVVKFKN